MIPGKATIGGTVVGLTEIFQTPEGSHVLQSLPFNESEHAFGGN